MIAIIDYGMGNLRSVQKGFEKVGHAAVITSDPSVVASADKVVLPGVGHLHPTPCTSSAATAADRSRSRDAIESGQALSGYLPGTATAVRRRATKMAGTKGWAFYPAKSSASKFRRSTKCRTWAGTSS